MLVAVGVLSSASSEVLALVQQRGEGQRGGGEAAGPPRGGGLANKAPDLPSGAFTASSTVARTKLRHEWVDIPVGNLKLHTWIEYPDGAGPAPVVIVMQHEAGLDDWMRALADQLALDGFIAVAPDVLSGMAPKGGNFDAFQFPDDAIKATTRLTTNEAMRRYRAARDYALKLPRANGKSAALGVARGGADAFRFAAEVPDLNAAVVFYGAAPDEAAMSRIKAPVLGLYGEDDFLITPTVERTAAAMKKLGKTYETQIYPGATHQFMRSQAEGQNGAATRTAWPRVLEFLRQHLK
jgi:carboxymethylenebutenolidase